MTLIQSRKYHISVCGQGRAGSSFLWKAAQRVLTQNGIKHESHLGIGLHHSFECKEHCVLKFHPWRQDVEDWTTHLILPRRDLREVVSSYHVNLRGIVSSKADARAATLEAISLHEQWEGESSVEFVYEEFREDPAAQVLKLARHLGLECDTESMLDELGRPPERKPWALPMELMQVIDDVGRDWLDRFGYPRLEEMDNPCDPMATRRKN